MMDRPTSLELVRAVRLYLEQELQPALTDSRLRFQTLVAAHVLGIVERELPAADRLLAEENECLAAILGQPVGAEEVGAANEELCRRIREGDYDEAGEMRALLGRLRPLVVSKLQIANPRYLNPRPGP
jgi:Domain of unknown function (DUF6285)